MAEVKTLSDDEAAVVAGGQLPIPTDADPAETAEWLNSLPLARLDRECEGGSIADRAFAICHDLIRETESIKGLPERQLPRLRDHGTGSQLAVVGQELSEVMASEELDRINPKLFAANGVFELCDLFLSGDEG